MRRSTSQRRRVAYPSSRHAKWHTRWAFLPIVIIVGLLSVGMPASAHAAPAPPDRHTLLASAPADVFMQAIIRQDGQLAWQQLCPALQEKLPAASLATLTKAQIGSHSEQGEQLSVDTVGTHVWAAGGRIHVYVVTAHWPSGDDIRALYVLRTQTTGCIDGVLIV